MYISLLLRCCVVNHKGGAYKVSHEVLFFVCVSLGGIFIDCEINHPVHSL